MHLHINHCYCTKPCWENVDFYDSRYMVYIEESVNYKHKESLNEENEENEENEDDWGDLIYSKEFFNQEEYDEAIEYYKSTDNREMVERFAKLRATMRDAPSLKKEVIDWLNENIKDNPKNKTQPQGWCMGNDNYRSTSLLSLTLWFYRRRDAMNFIKTWSSHKKPTTYLDYFNDIYKELVDGKLTIIKSDE